MRENDSAAVVMQRALDHFARVYARLRQRATEKLLKSYHAVLCIEERTAKHFVRQIGQRMPKVAEETLTAIAKKRGLQISSHLYGQEINPETYAVCKADMLLKGEGESADHIVGGAEWSTLSHDAFPAQVFDFMFANPPFGHGLAKLTAETDRLKGAGLNESPPRFPPKGGIVAIA